MTEDFDGCARECRATGRHTLEWGRCAHAERPPRPEPEFGWWRVIDAADGERAIVQANLPLTAVLPWAEHLTVDERHQMLEEATTAYAPAVVIQQWQRVAEARKPTRVLRPPIVNIAMGPPPPPHPGYSPAAVQAAYERGRRQGRYEMGG
ncbi:MAG TPA: hypothetical protein VF737_16265 [Gemmatimonadaceae bacterium]